MKLNRNRVTVTSVAFLASLAFAGLAVPAPASAIEDPLNQPPAEPCYWLPGPVPGGRCVPACDGEAPTVAVPSGGAPFYAPAGPQVIVGTEGADNIYGADDGNVICGRGGIDVIHAGDGADVVYGDGDPDQIYGEGDDDWIYGGSGGDVIDGQEGDDWIYGQADADGLRCGPNLDNVTGGGGAAIDFFLPNVGCEFWQGVESGTP